MEWKVERFYNYTGGQRRYWMEIMHFVAEAGNEARRAERQ
jgi:hypothetical protein